MLRFTLFSLVWLLHLALSLPLILLGLPLIAVLALLPGAAVLRASRHYKDGRAVMCWRWRGIDYVFGNDEDGIDGQPLDSLTAPAAPDGVMARQHWWVDKTASWSRWRRIFIWAAVRNSTANLRFAPFFGIVINPQRVKWRMRMTRDGFNIRWWLAWQGPRAGFRWHWNPSRAFWIGWKVKPQDGNYMTPTLPSEDARSPGVGFAFQPFGSA